MNNVTHANSGPLKRRGPCLKTASLRTLCHKMVSLIDLLKKRTRGGRGGDPPIAPTSLPPPSHYIRPWNGQNFRGDLSSYVIIIACAHDLKRAYGRRKLDANSSGAVESSPCLLPRRTPRRWTSSWTVPWAWHVSPPCKTNVSRASTSPPWPRAPCSRARTCSATLRRCWPIGCSPCCWRSNWPWSGWRRTAGTRL